MSRVTPLTAQTVTAISESRRATAVAFMADGELNATEAHALALLDEACRMVSIGDLARRTGDWVRDTGTLPEVIDISPYLMREWKELSEQPNPKDAA